MRPAACALASLLAVAALASAGLPPGVPPDGPAGPVVSLSDVAHGRLAVGTEVTTQLVNVTNVSCPQCDEATVAADFEVADGSGATVRAHEPHSWQSTFNVKKQLFVPTVGMRVVVQGAVASDAGGPFLVVKRWAGATHEGPSVTVRELARGDVPTGAYVWLDGVRVVNVARWNDGDHSFDLADPGGGDVPFVHAELPPPFWGQLRIPHANETVSVYGMARFDPDHAWWEIHPIRCWSRSECVTPSVGYLRNGPTPGTPSTGGVLLEGPLLPGEGNATEDAPIVTFRLDASAPGELVALVNSTLPVASVEASVANGSWEPMRSAQGAWVLDAGVPNGSSVRLRATLADGAGATSGLFTWTAAPSEALDAPEVAHAEERIAQGDGPNESVSPSANASASLPPRAAPGFSGAALVAAARVGALGRCPRD